MNLLSTTTLGVFACLVILPEGGNSFFFKRKHDCMVSSWSDWNPAGLGLERRERAVLRFPANGGKACPTDLSEIKSTNTNAMPTIKYTATAMKKHFLRRQGQVLRGKTVGQKRDLLIIVDSSGSITNNNFNIVKEQLARLMGLLCPVNDPFSNNYQKAALIQYSSTVKDEFNFASKSNTYQVKAGIKAMKYMGQSTCTGTAFQRAIGMLTTAQGMRTDPDVKQEVLILTDGQSNCGVNAINAAKALQQKADVFGLMIGTFSSSGNQELKSYVSGPIDQHIFAVQNFQDLTKLLNEIEAQIAAGAPCAPFDI